MKFNPKLAPLAAAVLAIGASQSTHAGESVEFGNGLKFDWRVLTTYTLSGRAEAQDPLLTYRAPATSAVNNAGGNDGNNNFDKGALTANRISALLETKLSKGDSGVVFSASTFYDDAYHRTNDNDPAASNPNRVNKPAPFNEFTEGARRYHGGYSRVLDAYGYTAFKLGESSRATVRVGRHVVNWGEALFYPGMGLAQGPADGTKANIPGTETKDVLLPEDQISAAVEVTPRWTLLSHAQFGFHPTLAPAPGSYFNTSDAVGPGGVCLGPFVALPAVPGSFSGFNGCSFGSRGEDIKPGKTGQWGIGTRYRVTDETEVGLYYLNFHDRTPLPEINAFTPGTATPAAFGIPGNQIGNGSYRIRYFEDVKLLGATVSTVLGKVAVAGELTHKKGAPVLVNTVVNPATGATIPNPTRADVTQASVNAFANVGRVPFITSLQLLGEVSAVIVNDVEARKAPGVEALGAAAAAFPASDTLSFKTSKGIAYTLQAVLGYPGFVEGWDLTVPISFAHQVKGRSLVGGTGGEGDKRLSLGTTFVKGGNLSIGVNYLAFLGDASLDLKTERKLTDRDQLSLVLKYAF
ncbi:DUF1302 domain-containing protein [Caldimonas tepidiphila]|uniref:DUF1302 domain-containing protein n=1 Tax=Caldimonas tepidiphila TaxID=2315841 RepID=UPI000E5B26A7|nr:DUF1302 family protein [Caldimonas tepidiphila]